MSRCFILGAGFSNPSGLPLGSELTALVFEHAFPAANAFRPDIREHWVTFLRHLYPQDNLETAWPDFEDLITVIDEWCIYQGEYEGKDRDCDPLSPPHFKYVLLRNLAQLMCERAAAAPRSAIDQVKAFVQSLTLGADTVISFNWDPLVEMACAELGVQVCYMNRPSTGLHMTKPHGSVTLAEMPRGDFEEASKSFSVRDVHVDWEHEGVVVVRADHPSDAANRIVAPFKETVIVEPTARKVYRSPWIKLQWRSAYDMLRCADEVYVIGFSLPSTDYRTRILLQAMTLDRAPAPSFQIVDPNAALVAERYRQVLNIDIRCVELGWQEWLAQGP